MYMAFESMHISIKKIALILLIGAVLFVCSSSGLICVFKVIVSAVCAMKIDTTV
jgi:hypothetical protein